MKNNNFYSKDNKLEAYVYFNNDDKLKWTKDWDLNDWQSLWLNFKISCKGIHDYYSVGREELILTEYEKFILFIENL